MILQKESKDRIIFPLDFPDIDSARKYIEILKGHIGLFKVGLELFVKEGPSILSIIKKEGRAKIFLDLKFHDITETVKGAMKSANALGAEFITVHCDEGRRLLESAVESASGKTKVLGVTVLTSLSGESLKEIGMREEFQDPLKLVLHRARIAKSAGCAGVVCSGLEASFVRKEFGKDFIIVTPGIRPSWSVIKNDDQQRIVTPSDAIKAGADYIVVGRPIRTAKDPVDAVKRIEKEIEDALR
ncbi:MAG TPA: orotidine-5'-phosphate decarboxylase [Nitrospinae bacterium]|nr:orotidine-5'-phosphate decarboxylase [Nitrospinota bacterium]HBA26900.1 orotidine-5'-phosphate decarboxylase [Nitrospinota bacterium]